MRKRSVKNNRYCDENIVKALKELPVPLKTFDDHEILFDENKRNESIFEHISKQKHKLKTSDIKQIPKIINDKNSLISDNKKNIFRNYLGQRPKKTSKLKYIKIVTKKVKSNVEKVITIYLIKNKNVEKKKKNR
jgi:hypothetical protein